MRITLTFAEIEYTFFRTMPDAEMTQEKWVSQEEVARHSSEDDLWVIIHGRAYDVTAFQHDHPGGPDILFSHAGEDGTEEFEDTFHSVVARKMLEDFFVGNVKGMEQTDYSVHPAQTVASDSYSISSILFIFLPIIAVAIALYYNFVLEVF